MHKRIALRYFSSLHGKDAAWQLLDDGFDETMPDMSAELLTKLKRKPSPRLEEKELEQYGHKYRIPRDKT